MIHDYAEASWKQIALLVLLVGLLRLATIVANDIINGHQEKDDRTPEHDSG